MGFDSYRVGWIGFFPVFVDRESTATVLNDWVRVEP